jgi:choline-sulfatase
VNFVIFMPDEMRAESAGCYGHPLVQTPNLDRLAAEGTCFRQCYAQHPVCSPSRCSLFTGWYPHVAGHRTLWHLLRPHEPNTLKSLKAAGYGVRWYGKNDLLAADSFAESVTEATVPPNRGHGGGLLRRGPDDPLYDSFLADPAPMGPWETGDGACVRAGIDFLRSRPDRPFVLYLPLTYPHPAYTAPAPWHEMYPPHAVPPLRPADAENKPAFHDLIRRTRRLDRLTDADFRRIAAVYLGMISYVDFLLGALLDALDATGLAESTTEFFTADHGDWAGEYGLVEKWPSALDDTIIRVPLVVRTPGGAAGHVVHTPVELFDISATMLEQAGVEAGHSHFARSLAPQLAGTPGDADRCAFAEGGYDPFEPHCFEGRPEFGRKPDHIYYRKGALQQSHPHSVCRSVMARDATCKLIYRAADACELYDMEADPRELRNLYGTAAGAAAQRRLEARLLQFYLGTSDVTPYGEDPRGLPRGGYRTPEALPTA